MEIIRFPYRAVPQIEEKVSICLGAFDGIHRGHQEVFLRCVLDGSYLPSVLLFSAPVSQFLFHKDPKVITSLEDQLNFLPKCKIERAYVVEIDEGFFALSKEEFMEKILSPLGVKEVYCGTDYRFGYKAEGGIPDLEKKYRVCACALLEEDGRKISSTDIRSLVENGEMEKVTSLLGRPYEVTGVVAKGYHNGTSIGYPTANIALSSPYAMPKNGVYFGIAYVSGMPYRAMVNVGVAPTVGKLTSPVIEAHLLSYDGDCYQKRIYLSFVSYLRGEHKFASLEELKEQLKKDEETVRRFEF